MWQEGTVRFEGSIYKYWALVFEEGSEYGIEEGRISKLSIRRDGQEVCNYDRGWDIYPIDEDTEEVLAMIFTSYL